MSDKIFTNALDTAGLSSDDVKLKAAFQSLADDAGLTITNKSAYSPFWCFVQSAATVPVKWFVRFTAEVIMPNMYAKTASGTFLDLIAYAYDVTRKDATKATGNIVFRRGVNTGVLEIPMGTRVRTVKIRDKIYRMVTTADAVIAEGATSVSVPVEAMEAGTAYNLGANYYVIMDSDLKGVVSVTNENDWLVMPGTDTESDDLLRLRIRNQFAAAGEWHTDAKYKAMISTISGFRPDRIYFDHDIPRGPGSADAYVLFDAGTVPEPLLEALNKYIQDEGNHGHGDDLIVKALPSSEHDVGVLIYFKNSVPVTEYEELLAEIEQVIRCAFRENEAYVENVTQTWAYSRFSFSQLDKELHTFFPEIESLIWDQGDIISNLDVPRLGELEIRSENE